MVWPCEFLAWQLSVIPNTHFIESILGIIFQHPIQPTFSASCHLSWAPTAWSWLAIPFICMLSSTQNVIPLLTHSSRLNRIYIPFLFYNYQSNSFHCSTVLNRVGKLWPMAQICPLPVFCVACKLRTCKSFYILNGWIKIKRIFHDVKN